MVMPGDNVRTVVSLIAPIAMDEGLRRHPRRWAPSAPASWVIDRRQYILRAVRNPAVCARPIALIGRAAVSKTAGWGF